MEKLFEKLKDLKNEILVELIQKVRTKIKTDRFLHLKDIDFHDLPRLIYDDGKTYRVVFISHNLSQFEPNVFYFHCCDSMDTTKDTVLTLTEEYISTDELLKLLNSI